MNKNKTLLIVLGIFALVIVTTAASFAFFTYSRTGSTTSTVISGDIEFSYIEGESATLTNAFPVKDSIGAIDEAGEYEFQVKMKSSSENVKVDYNVYLVDNNGGSDKYFTNEQIKFALIKNDVFVANTSATEGVKLSTLDGFNEGVSTGEGLVLEEQEISSNVTDNYKLRIWISDDVNYSNTSNTDDNTDLNNDSETSVGKYNGYKYSLKVKVTSGVTNSITINTPEITGRTITTTISDENGLSAYAITKNSSIPEENEWIEITNNSAKSKIMRTSTEKITSKEISYEVENAGSYYLHVKNKLNEVKSKKVSIEMNVSVNYNGSSHNVTSNDGISYFKDIIITENDKAIVCNNDGLPSYYNNKLIVSELKEETTCTIYDSFQAALSNLDNTENNLVMLNDSEEENSQPIDLNTKNVVVDLNGNVVKINSNNSGVVIRSYASYVKFYTSKESGGVIIDATNGLNKCVPFLYGHSEKENHIVIQSGYYYSNASWACSMVQGSSDRTRIEGGLIEINGQEANVCTSNIEDYKSGLCMFSENGPVLKNNGVSYNTFNIYGGTFINNSSTSSVYLTDAPGGETNIYGGYFKSTGQAISIAGENQTLTRINICGGTFNSPIDINLQNDNNYIYYKSTGINWYNNLPSPTTSGTYKNNILLDDTLNCTR